MFLLSFSSLMSTTVPKQSVVHIMYDEGIEKSSRFIETFEGDIR